MEITQVVERLAKECIYHSGDVCGLDLNKATAILHSWRERRVQELEEALRQARGKLLIMADSPFWVNTLQREEISKELHLLSDEIKTTLANSEWREQIRKGAKHDRS